MDPLNPPDDALLVDQEDGSLAVALAHEHAVLAGDLAMRPEVGQQGMADTTHGAGPGLQGEHGVDTHAQNLGASFVKLRQRTVERGSLIASAAGEGEGKGV